MKQSKSKQANAMSCCCYCCSYPSGLHRYTGNPVHLKLRLVLTSGASFKQHPSTGIVFESSQAEICRKQAQHNDDEDVVVVEQQKQHRMQQQQQQQREQRIKKLPHKQNGGSHDDESDDHDDYDDHNDHEQGDYVLRSKTNVQYQATYLLTKRPRGTKGNKGGWILVDESRIKRPPCSVKCKKRAIAGDDEDEDKYNRNNLASVLSQRGFRLRVLSVPEAGRCPSCRKFRRQNGVQSADDDHNGHQNEDEEDKKEAIDNDNENVEPANVDGYFQHKQSKMTKHDDGLHERSIVKIGKAVAVASGGRLRDAIEEVESVPNDGEKDDDDDDDDDDDYNYDEIPIVGNSNKLSGNFKSNQDYNQVFVKRQRACTWNSAKMTLNMTSNNCTCDHHHFNHHNHQQQQRQQRQCADLRRLEARKLAAILNVDYDYASANTNYDDDALRLRLEPNVKGPLPRSRRRRQRQMRGDRLRLSLEKQLHNQFIKTTDNSVSLLMRNHYLPTREPCHCSHLVVPSLLASHLNETNCLNVATKSAIASSLTSSRSGDVGTITSDVEGPRELARCLDHMSSCCTNDCAIIGAGLFLCALCGSQQRQRQREQQDNNDTNTSRMMKNNLERRWQSRAASLMDAFCQPRSARRRSRPACCRCCSEFTRSYKQWNKCQLSAQWTDVATGFNRPNYGEAKCQSDLKQQQRQGDNGGRDCDLEDDDDDDERKLPDCNSDTDDDDDDDDAKFDLLLNDLLQREEKGTNNGQKEDGTATRTAATLPHDHSLKVNHIASWKRATGMTDDKVGHARQTTGRCDCLGSHGETLLLVMEKYSIAEPPQASNLIPRPSSSFATASSPRETSESPSGRRPREWSNGEPPRKSEQHGRTTREGKKFLGGTKSESEQQQRRPSVSINGEAKLYGSSKERSIAININAIDQPDCRNSAIDEDKTDDDEEGNSAMVNAEWSSATDNGVKHHGKTSELSAQSSFEVSGQRQQRRHGLQQKQTMNNLATIGNGNSVVTDVTDVPVVFASADDVDDNYDKDHREHRQRRLGKRYSSMLLAAIVIDGLNRSVQVKPDLNRPIELDLRDLREPIVASGQARDSVVTPPQPSALRGPRDSTQLIAPAHVQLKTGDCKADEYDENVLLYHVENVPATRRQRDAMEANICASRRRLGLIQQVEHASTGSNGSGFLIPINGKLLVSLQFDLNYASGLASECRNVYVKYKLFERVHKYWSLKRREDIGTTSGAKRQRDSGQEDDGDDDDRGANKLEHMTHELEQRDESLQWRNNERFIGGSQASGATETLVTRDELGSLRLLLEGSTISSRPDVRSGAFHLSCGEQILIEVNRKSRQKVGNVLDQNNALDSTKLIATISNENDADLMAKNLPLQRQQPTRSSTDQQEDTVLAQLDLAALSSETQNEINDERKTTEAMTTEVKDGTDPISPTLESVRSTDGDSLHSNAKNLHGVRCGNRLVDDGPCEMVLLFEVYSSDFYADKLQGWSMLNLPINQTQPTRRLASDNVANCHVAASLTSSSSSSSAFRVPFAPFHMNHDQASDCTKHDHEYQCTRHVELPVMRPTFSAPLDRLRYYLIGAMPRETPKIESFVAANNRYMTQTQPSGKLHLSYELSRQFSDDFFDLLLRNLLRSQTKN